MDETDAVEVSRTSDGITIIALNRAHRRNAVDPTTAQKLYDAFLAFDNDETQKVCVFHGKHGTFCAGADLQALSSRGSDDSWATKVTVGQPSKGPMGPSRLQLSKPVIAAVSGYAVAGGLELSLLADMRIVEEDTIFGVFCRRWGVPLIDGGTVRLPAVVGIGRAMDMILTGRPVDAQEAHQMGLANKVVPKGASLAEAISVAKQLVTFPQICMNTDRRNCYYSVYGASSFEDAIASEFEHGVGVVEAEGVKGASRFAKGSGRHGTYKL
jgi:enoyl-CoA hydratase/carnithine racemase